jgi:hypothetical protein
LLLFRLAVFLHEAVHSSGGIHEFLLSGKEGMALGTDVYPDAGAGGAGVDYFSAGTDNRTILVFGMNLVFHVYNLLQ